MQFEYVLFRARCTNRAARVSRVPPALRAPLSRVLLLAHLGTLTLIYVRAPLITSTDPLAYVVYVSNS